MILSHLIVLLEYDLDIQQTDLRGQFVECQSRTSVAQQSGTKNISTIAMLLSYFIVLLKSNLDAQQINLRGQLVELPSQT